MSIKADDIEVKRYHDEKAGRIEYAVRILLTNTHMIPETAFLPLEKADKLDMEAAIFHNLRMSILAHIYNDMIEPINELATLAGRHSPDLSATEEINELQARLQRIVRGEKEPTLIVVPE